jgi:hypothetical protein
LKAIGNWLLVFESGELDFYQTASKFNSRQSGDWRTERKSIAWSGDSKGWRSGPHKNEETRTAE